MNDQAPRLDASALILAGGKSSRMGRPKALLPFDGEPLIVHTVRSLATRFADIVVVAAPGQELPQLPVTLVTIRLPIRDRSGGSLTACRPPVERCVLSPHATPRF